MSKPNNQAGWPSQMAKPDGKDKWASQVAKPIIIIIFKFYKSVTINKPYK